MIDPYAQIFTPPAKKKKKPIVGQQASEAYQRRTQHEDPYAAVGQDIVSQSLLRQQQQDRLAAMRGLTPQTPIARALGHGGRPATDLPMAARLANRFLLSGASGLGADFIPGFREAAGFERQALLAPRSRAEAWIGVPVDIGGTLTGFTLGPAKALAVIGKPLQAANVGARLLTRMGPVAATKAAPIISSMVRFGGEGFLFGAAEATAEHFNEIKSIYQKQGPIAASQYLGAQLTRRGLTTARDWALFGGGLEMVGLVGKGFLARRHLQALREPQVPRTAEQMQLGIELPPEDVRIQLRAGKWEIVPPEQAGKPVGASEADRAILQMEAAAGMRIRPPVTPLELPAGQISLMREKRPHLFRRFGPLFKAIQSEEGAIALDIPGAAVVEEKIATIRKNRVLHNPIAIGAARFVEDKSLLKSFSRWSESFLAQVDRLNPALRPQVEPRLGDIYEGSKKLYATVRIRAVNERLPTVRRLMGLYHAGEGGQEWYSDVYNQLANAVGKDHADFLLNALAVTSQGNSVKGNVNLAMKALFQHLQGRDFEGLNFDAAKSLARLQAGEAPDFLGRKLRNFLLALRGDPQAVVVDRWMMRSFKFKGDVPTDQQYDVIEAWVKAKAAELGVTPAQFQARMWVGIRTEFPKLGRDPQESFLSVLQARPDLLQRVNIIRGRFPDGRITTPPEWQSPEGIQAAVAGQQYGIVTAQNPGHGVVAKLRPGELPNDALLRELQARGYTDTQIIPIKGFYPNDAGKVVQEDSFLVLGMPAHETLKFGQRFGQAAVIVPEGLADTTTRMLAPRTSAVKFGDEAIANEIYSVVNTERGPLPFALQFDFDALRPMTRGGARELIQQIQLGVEGAVKLPGGEGPVIRAKWNPNTGKFEIPQNAPPGAAAYLQRLESQYRSASFRQTLVTGEAPTVPPEARLKVKDGRIVEADHSLIKQAEEIGTSFKLWSPLTHIRNIVSNTAVMLVRPLEAEAAGAIGAVRSALTGGAPRERFMGEGVQQVFGMLAGVQDIVPSFLRAWKGELTGKFVEQVGAVRGPVGEVIRYPFRALEAMDSVFKDLNRRMTIYQTAYRIGLQEGRVGDALTERIAELTKAPTEEMVAAARQKALEYTFQERLGTTGHAFTALRDAVPGGRFIVPFIRTPVNIAKYFARRTPLGALTAIGKTGGEMEDNLARAAIGSILAMGAVAYAWSGHITGNGPDNPKQKELLYAAGWQPYSIRVGNKWVSYRGFEPVATFMAMAANIVESAKGEDHRNSIATQLMNDAARGLADATYVNAMSELFDAITDPGHRLQRYAGTVVSGGIIPSIVSATARAVDPTIRDPKNFVEELEMRVPGLSRRVAPKLDVFGKPIVREDIPFITPRITTVQNDPLVAELVRLGVSLPGVAPTVTRKGEKVRREPEKVRALKEERGQRYRERLTQLIHTDSYQRLSDEQKRQVMQRWIRLIVDSQRGR